MESSKRATSTSQAGNGEFELEMAAKEQQNGATDAGEAWELLLDSSKAGAIKRREFFDNLLKCVEDDNVHFLQRQKERIERHVFFADRSGKSTLLRALAGQLDKTLKIMGLEICADTMVGDAMRRGISGGQKKRLTTGVVPQIRFFCQFLILSLVHHSVTSFYRFIASYAQTNIVSFFYVFLGIALFLVFGGFILPKPKTSIPIMKLALTFHNLNYYVDTPPEMLKQGYPARKLQLLHSVTGAFRPGVLSALMGVSGAGKTTLLDVLAGRKTGGSIEGDIRIGGYPKLTVKESVTYSAWLRLPPQVDGKTRHEFVNEVLKIVELDEIKDTLVGIQGINGLSLEQRKRLTVAVELISNPSVILMDEPTTGLDARSAAIVIRAVKNISETGRTVVCTIHQPSIDIFEAFDEVH
ncbi:hypothetical protein PR202_ga12654 [Eleusine coracana subsp. coracana]|uniref:ABC transporter domain-containing protein n=1 Tax=Eleusine coracana subsp. coracana TaxID=191504 RepID=A0AAV5CCT4_ELECO|nr:hypothetical protein PR202_ga12654 [Eleusine coracana subsp. coracana]